MRERSTRQSTITHWTLNPLVDMSLACRVPLAPMCRVPLAPCAVNSLNSNSRTLTVAACRVPLAPCAVNSCTTSTLSTCPWRAVYASQPRHVVNVRHCTTPVYACVVYASHLARMPCPWRGVYSSQPRHVVDVRHCTRTAPPPSPPHAPMPSWTCELRKTSKTCIASWIRTLTVADAVLDLRAAQDEQDLYRREGERGGRGEGGRPGPASGVGQGRRVPHGECCDPSTVELFIRRIFHHA